MTTVRRFIGQLSPPLVALAILGVIVAGVAAPSGAKTTAAERKKRAEQLATLREQVQEASATEAELLDRFDAARKTRLELDERVAEVDAQLAKEQVGLDAATEKLNAVQGELVRVQLKLDFAQAQVADARDDLRRRAVAAYINQPASQAANVFLRVRTVRELATSRVYLNAVLHNQNQVLSRMKALEADASSLRRVVEDKRAEAKIAFDEFRERTQTLEVARAQQDALRQEALAFELGEKALLDEAASRKSEFESEIAALLGESRSLEAMLRARQSGAAPPPYAGMLDPPIPGAIVSSKFGPRLHPILDTIRMHNGLDLRGGFGTPILSAGDGEVVWAGPRGGYGNTTVVDHGNSIATLYAHQQSVLVQVGDQVARGQLIGLVGSTGLSTGPHLHFEVRVRGTPVDPLNYL